MFTAFLLSALILIILIIGKIIHVHSLLLMVKKDKEIIRQPNQLVGRYQFIKGLY